MKTYSQKTDLRAVIYQTSGILLEMYLPEKGWKCRVFTFEKKEGFLEKKMANFMLFCLPNFQVFSKLLFCINVHHTAFIEQ